VVNDVASVILSAVPNMSPIEPTPRASLERSNDHGLGGGGCECATDAADATKGYGRPECSKS